MEKVNSQLSIALEEVTREHREKAEVLLICFGNLMLNSRILVLSGGVMDHLADCKASPT